MPLLRTLRTLALLGAALFAAFCAALLLAAAVPNAPIAGHLRGDPALADNYRASPLTGGKVDVYTDCVAMGEGLAADPADPLWRRALRAPVIGPCGTLTDWLAGKPTGAVDYFRYWNGYALVTRPALALAGYGPLRAAALALAVTLLGALLVLTGRRLGLRIAACLAAALLFVGVDVAVVTVVHSLAWSLAAAAGLWVLRAEWHRLWRAEPWFVLGALITFLELLNNALVTLTLPLALALLRAHAEGEAPGATLRGAAQAAGGWALGYFGLWTARFALAWLTLGGGAWAVIADKATEKLSGATAQGEPTPLLALRLNLEQLAHPRWRLAAILAFGALLVWRILKRHRGPRGLRLAALAAVAALPLAWFAVFANHSIVHAWFTARLLAPTLFLLLASATEIEAEPE